MSFISFPVIFNLPLEVQLPGMLLLALIAYRGVRAVMSFKLIKTMTSILMFVAVAIILSQFGNAFVTMLTDANP